MSGFKWTLLVLFTAIGTACKHDNGDSLGAKDASVVDATTPRACPSMTFPNCRDGWCIIHAGAFQMGSPPDEWGRDLNSEDSIAVTLTHDFVIEQFELTQLQWSSLGRSPRFGQEDAGPQSVGACSATDCPATNLSWFEAIQFANDLSAKDGRPPCYALNGCAADGGPACGTVGPSTGTVYDCTGYRLPTDAEWEYAARAGTTTAFYSGAITPLDGGWAQCAEDQNLLKIGWYCANSPELFTHEVGLRAPNAWGLYDMSGNALEFSGDPDQGRSKRTPIDPWQAMAPTDDPVSRGGCVFQTSAQERSAERVGATRVTHTYATGFRLARTVLQNEPWTSSALPVRATCPPK
jgi:formylglycine-generating enzyme required for sulfatase activity